MADRRTPLVLHSIAVLALLLLLAVPAHAQLIEETGSLRGFLAGSEPAAGYDNWISHTSEGIARTSYNDYGPDHLDPQNPEFGDFRLIPNTQQGDAILAAWRSAFDALYAGDIPAVEALLADSSDSWRYDLILFHDTDTGRDLYILREQLDPAYVDDSRTPDDPTDDITGSFRNGWGVYVFNPDATRASTMVQVPHPNDDFIAPYVAIDLWDRLDAALLMINGAGREVLWLQGGNYSNDRSLSDPTRYERHPLNMAVQAFADRFPAYPEIALSWQMHSFDPSHTGLHPVIFSAGFQTNDPHLPLRDESYEDADVFNQLPHPVFEAGDWDLGGEPLPALPLNGYAMLHKDEPFFVVTQQGDTLAIPSAGNLYGNPTNHPGNYVTREGHYIEGQALEPFVHIELDEFPTYFDTNGMPREDLFDLSVFPPEYSTFAPILAFYEPMLDAIDAWYAWYDTLDGGAPPPMPEGLWALSDGNGGMYAGWAGPEDGKLLTYQILGGSEPPTPDSPVIWSQVDDILMRRVGFNSTTDFAVLGEGTQYIAVRQVDLAGQVGPLTPAFPVVNYDTTPVGLEHHEFSRFPVDAWPVWLSVLPFTSDIGTIDAHWRINGGDVTVTPLAPVGQLGAWAVALPRDLSVLPGDTLEYQFHTTDLSDGGNPAQFPEDGWFVTTLDDGDNLLAQVQFERPDDAINPQSDWEIGVPTSGPGSAKHGERVLATVLDGPYESSNPSVCIFTEATRPEYGPLVAIWWQYVDYPLVADYPGLAAAGGRVRTANANFDEIEPQGGYPYRTIAGKDVYSGSSGGWQPVTLDLREIYGYRETLRFVSETNGATGHDGWYIDQFQLVRWFNSQPPQPFALLDPIDDTASQDPVHFAWQPALDADDHAHPAYRLALKVGERVQRISVGTVTSAELSRARIASLLGKPTGELRWWVEAISQGDTVRSRDTGTLRLDATLVQDDASQPLAFKLHPPYPNPFNHTLRVRVDLPESGELRLRLVNVLGREVLNRTEPVAAPGSRLVTLDGRDLASGVYLLQVQAGSHRDLRKVVLLK